MRVQLVCLALTAVSCVSSGCSMIMATRAPEKRDLSVLTPGTSRSRVIAELGVPAESRETRTGQVDLFSFNQGYSMGARVSRCMMHGLLDVNTLCLWELIGTPLETSLDGEPVRAEVAYDPEGRIASIEYFAGAHLANGGPTLATWMRKKDVVQTATIGTPPQSPATQQSDVMPASAATATEVGPGEHAVYNDGPRNPVSRQP